MHRKENKTEKCLVCITAQLRAKELTWENFKKFVLDQLKADLALCIGVDKNTSRKNKFYQYAKYIWEYDDPKDYTDAYNYAKEALKSEEDWRILLKIKGIWLGGIKGEGAQPSGSAIGMFYKWLLKQKLIEHKLISKYDRFIVTRSDFFYCAPHPPLELLASDKIWIPRGENYGGCGDRHLIASSKDIIKCINLLDDIILRPKELYRKMCFHQSWNAEQYLALHLRENDLKDRVRRFPRVMFLVRGEKDDTRWSQGEYNNKLNLIVRYRKEFIESKYHSKVIKNNDDWKRILRTPLAIKNLIISTLLCFMACKLYSFKVIMNKKFPKLTIVLRKIKRYLTRVKNKYNDLLA